MINKNFQSSQDKKLIEMADRYEMAKANGQPIYFDAEDFADLAEWYTRHNKYKSARILLEYALTLHPGNTSLLIELAYEHLDKRRVVEARKIAQEIEEVRDDAIILQARLLLEEGKPEEAELELDKLEDKFSSVNVIDIAYMYLDAGDTDKTREWLTHWRWDPDNIDYCAITADLLSATGEYEKAIVYFNKLIDSNPYSASYWYGLARCHFELQDFEKTIEACDYALVSDDELGDAYMLKGYAYSSLHNADKAMECYTMALKHHAITPTLMHTLMGVTRIDAGEWEEGYEHLKIVIESSQNTKDPLMTSTVFSNAALCLKNLDMEKNKELIIQYCEKAIELDPFNTEGYWIRGLMYVYEGDPQKAIQTWNKSAELNPEAATWMEIANYSFEGAMFEYSISALKQVEKIDPDFPQLNERFTLTYILLQNAEQANWYNQRSELPIPQSMLDEINEQMKHCTKTERIHLLDKYFKELFNLKG